MFGLWFTGSVLFVLYDFESFLRCESHDNPCCFLDHIISKFLDDFSKYVGLLLDAGLPALIYAGDVDFICNYLGNQAWTYNLEWSGTAGFQSAPVHDWNDGKGLARTYGGFTFLQVYDAGHMVPKDQPKVSLDMIANFVDGGDF